MPSMKLVGRQPLMHSSGPTPHTHTHTHTHTHHAWLHRPTTTVMQALEGTRAMFCPLLGPNYTFGIQNAWTCPRHFRRPKPLTPQMVSNFAGYLWIRPMSMTPTTLRPLGTSACTQAFLEDAHRSLQFRLRTLSTFVHTLGPHTEGPPCCTHCSPVNLQN